MSKPRMQQRDMKPIIIIAAIATIVLALTGTAIWYFTFYKPSHKNTSEATTISEDSQIDVTPTEISAKQDISETQNNENQTESIPEEIDPDTPETVQFISREQHAAETLPYYMKDFTVETVNKKDVASAVPDIDVFTAMTVPELKSDINSICKELYPEDYEKVLQVMTVFIGKNTDSVNYMDQMLKAMYTYEKYTDGISYIEFCNDTMTAFDINKKKIAVNINEGIVKTGSTEITPNDDFLSAIGETIHQSYGYMIPIEAERQQALEEEETLAAEEQKKLKEEKAAAEQKAALDAMLAMQAANTHAFTDKNGEKTTFTKAEWDYLISLWAYTGHAETLVAQHTNAELRQVLANR